MKQRFSIPHIIDRAKATVLRFPLAILVALVATILGIVVLHQENIEDYINVFLTLSFALPLAIGGVLFAEVRKLKPLDRGVTISVAVAFLLVYYSLLPEIGRAHDDLYIRHAMWAFGFVLLITFIPFIFQKSKEGVIRFWQYNRGLIFTWILTGIWVGALMAGISIALGSIDFLFDINIDEKRYAEIWMILNGVFAPMFFLNRLPNKPVALDTSRPFPKEVRLFSQFVLVPLVSAYFLILYAYTIRIVLTSEWPEGQLAYMIIGFSFLGVLTYLALHPLREKLAWVRHAGTVLFAAMIPQVGMLFWALWFRVSEYGITENRYFVALFGLWLLGIAIFFLVRKQKDIRIIPVSLFVLAVLSSFGPWGAFFVSEWSQVDRLEGILIQNELLVDGKYQKPEGELNRDDQVEISSIVRYLGQRHGFDAIESWFDAPFKIEDLDRWEITKKVLDEHFGLEEYYPSYRSSYEPNYNEQQFLYIYTDQFKADLVDISSSEYFGNVSLHQDNEFTAGEDIIRFDVQSSEMKINVFKNGHVIDSVSLQPLVNLAQDQVNNRGSVSMSEATMRHSSPVIDLTLVSESFGLTKDSDSSRVNSIDAWVFFALK